ncbi:MAG: long-chain fatty acid--CoA ligase [Clostridiaceae bacterium]|nr:long-chain fatty acid--CoA ligase [Clostridiaceae bacterium]
MFTSGTTGKNKRVPLKNYNVVQAILAYENALDLSPADSTIIATPIYYVTGLIALFGLFLKVGGEVYLRKRFHVEEIIQLILEKNITLIHGSPVVFNLILGQRPNTPAMDSLRYFLCGSGPMSVEKINEINQWLPNVEFRTVYGLTETSSPLTIMNEAVAGSKHKGSSGRPVATADVRIVGDDGTDLGTEEIGNVEVRGATVIRSYYLDEYPELFSEGSWLKTGDIGYVSNEGYLYVLDRKKDMINVGGEKVAGSSVEDQIYGLGIADEVAVVAVADELFGEIVGAMIVYKENQEVSAEKLQQLLSSRIPKYQIPKVILQVSEIPKNENMKLDKVKVRQLLNDYKREHE